MDNLKETNDHGNIEEYLRLPLPENYNISNRKKDDFIIDQYNKKLRFVKDFMENKQKTKGGNLYLNNISFSPYRIYDTDFNIIYDGEHDILKILGLTEDKNIRRDFIDNQDYEFKI
jgi:hypothetical protein